MAVYTRISPSDIDLIAQKYALGQVELVSEISEGVENSNFCFSFHRPNNQPLKTIFTIFEKRVATADLPFYMHLMGHLAAKNIACPKPYLAEGEYLIELHNKSAAMVSFLSGKSVTEANIDQLEDLGRFVASMHLATQDFPETMENKLSLAGWQILANKISARVDEIYPNLSTLIANEISYLQQNWPNNLPQGIIHADIFPDNVFFAGDQTCGIIDFYFACQDFLAYEVAIIINAWCFDDAQLNLAKKSAFLTGYQAIRPLTTAEQTALPVLLRGAALRFLLTRSHDLLFGDKTALVTPKNPLEYINKLKFYQNP